MIYTPDLGMPGVRKLRAETMKIDAKQSMSGKGDKAETAIS